MRMRAATSITKNTSLIPIFQKSGFAFPNAARLNNEKFHLISAVVIMNVTF